MCVVTCVAAILDALRGPHRPGFLKATSRMGEEIDSLADSVNSVWHRIHRTYGTCFSHSLLAAFVWLLLYAVLHRAATARLQRDALCLQARLRERVIRRHSGPAGAIGRDRPAVRPRCSFGDGGGRPKTAVVVWMIGVLPALWSHPPIAKSTRARSPNHGRPALGGDPRFSWRRHSLRYSPSW